MFDELIAIPGYYIKLSETKKIPFLITVSFVNTANQIIFTPAVEQSINKICEITGTEGLLTIKAIHENFSYLTKFLKAVKIAENQNAIVLVHCWNEKIAEKLMEEVSKNCELNLIQRTGK